VWQGDAPPAAQIFPQPLLADGRLLDQVIGQGFAVIGTPATLAAVPAPTRQRWQQHAAVVLPATDPALLGWLQQHQVEAVLLRPDRYIAGAARNAAGLDQISQCLPAAPTPVTA
jgi:3-(3-hydroxy-phenyl)propionate hydroxylase